MTLSAALRAVLMFGLVLVAWPAMAGEVRDPAVHFFLFRSRNRKKTFLNQIIDFD